MESNDRPGVKLREMVLRGSNPDMLSLDSLEEMEKVLDHAKKFTITVGEVNLGECDFTAPTLDKRDKSPKLMCAGIGGCPFCEHKEAIRRAALQMSDTAFPTLNIPPGMMSFSLDKGIMHEFKRSRPWIIWDSYAAAITEKPEKRIPEYHRSKKNFFSKPDPDDIRPRKLLTGKQKAKRSAKNKMQKISRMSNRR